MMYRLAALFIVCILAQTATVPALPAPAQPAAPHLSTNAYWGMNAYLTKLERNGTGDNRSLLTTLTTQAGVNWTLEEMVWDLIEPQNNNFTGAPFDATILATHNAGIKIIGMLITTPAWARDSACSGNFLCAPSSAAEYAQWAGWMAERYDGDGISDAPGSPKIDAWQIWNEPNFPEQFVHPNEFVRRQRYGQMTVQAYQAIKAANPNAIVVLGGVYIFNGTAPDGFWFLNPNDGVFGVVPQAKTSFDVFGFHPYMPTVAPDQPGEFTDALLEARVRTARSWVNNDAGRPDAALWITEIGWCTNPGSSDCPPKTEAQQANYLIRGLVIAQQNGVDHTSWLQLEDAFNGGHPWSGSALLGNYTGSAYPQKLSYTAYKTLATTLNTARPVGVGPAHTHVFQSGTFMDNGTYDYRYTRSTTVIDVLWVPSGTRQVAFSVIANKQVQGITRNGQTFAPQQSGNTLTLQLSEDPILIIQREPSNLLVAPTTLPLLSKNGAAAQNTLSLTNAAEGSTTWTAADNAAWLSLSATNGTTPAVVVATAAAGTPDGSTATITFTSNGQTDTVQVTVRNTNVLYRLLGPTVRK